jgi:hypothetical protein
MANGEEGQNAIDDEDLDLEGGEPKDVVDFFDSTADGVIPDDVDFAERCMAEQGISLGETLALVGTDIDRAVFPISLQGAPAARGYGLVNPGNGRGFTHLVEPRCLDGLSIKSSSDSLPDKGKQFTTNELFWLAIHLSETPGADMAQIFTGIGKLAEENRLPKRDIIRLLAKINRELGLAS